MSDMPKRPMSAYMLWLNSAREKIKVDNPGLKVTEIAKKGGEIWRSMTDKSDWEEKAAEAKEQYTKDLVSYEVNVELARRLNSIGDGVVKSLANWKRLSEETQPQPSSSETGQSASPSLSNPNAPPQQSAVEPAPSAASVSRDPDAATSQATQEAQRTRPRQNRDENLPDWAYDLEERRIAVEERIAQEIAGLGETNRAILGCLQQLIQLLQEHNMNS